MCDTAIQFSSSTSTVLYHIKNKHTAAMSEDGTQPKIMSLLSRGESVLLLVHLPISVMEGEGFKGLVRYLEPEYIMASRATMAL